MNPPITASRTFLLANIMPLHAAHPHDPARLRGAVDLFMQELALEVGTFIGSVSEAPATALCTFMLHMAAGAEAAATPEKPDPAAATD